VVLPLAVASAEPVPYMYAMARPMEPLEQLVERARHYPPMTPAERELGR
jgi:hypothetical protein